MSEPWARSDGSLSVASGLLDWKRESGGEAKRDGGVSEGK